jgi:hypothetical protein
MRAITLNALPATLAITLTALTACGPSAKPEPALTLVELKSADLQTEYVSGGVIRLTGGEYREPAAPGGASETVVTLTGQTAYAPLVSGQPAAVAIVATQTGGSGTFLDLVVITRRDGQPTQIAGTHLGDRVKIETIAFDKGIVTLAMVVHGPDDPLCCPTQRVTRRYELRFDSLVQLPT